MANLKKPECCPQCKGHDLQRIMVTWTTPHYEGYICNGCIQEIESAIFPDAFIIYRRKRVKDHIQFTVDVPVSFPRWPANAAVVRWFNRRWTGRSEIAQGAKLSEEHRKAVHLLYMCRRARLIFEVDKSGGWKLVGARKA